MRKLMKQHGVSAEELLRDLWSPFFSTATKC